MDGIPVPVLTCIACGKERPLGSGMACHNSECQNFAGEAMTGNLLGLDAGIPSIPAIIEAVSVTEYPVPCPDALGYDPAKLGGE